MARRRWSEEVAETVANRLKKSKDISEFIRSISDQATWLGRRSRYPRLLFTEKLVEEMKNAKIIFLKEKKNVQSRRKSEEKRRS